MCGFAGFFDVQGAENNAAAATAKAMADCLQHRGPDDAGCWTDGEAGIALAHRRLSVLDLSQAGHQPMVSHSERYVIALNGEIYNHLELRARLQQERHAPDWRGHSDTETLLAAIDAWGIVTSLERCVGMFAFALWDRRDRTLTLARDRLGEKPLYYGQQQGVLLFGSELKALRAHPAFSASIDRDRLADYFRRGYVEAPGSIFRGVFKLTPGHYVQIGDAGAAIPASVAYWSLSDVAARGHEQPFNGSDVDALDALERVLGDAVALQSVADVPLGAFLSGGIDSSTVVALLQRSTSIPVKTFTIGFAEDAYDEAEHARAVARHLGTQHTEHYVTAEEALGLIPSLPTIYDEPFGDSSAIPTTIVSTLARQQVTVSLSGDGGDELFGGYSRYARVLRLRQTLGRYPRFLRHSAAATMTTVSGAAGTTGVGQRVGRLARYLASDSTGALYEHSVAQRHDATQLVLGASANPSHAGPHLQADVDDRRRMMFADTISYLPDDILTKVDRAAMSVSLETRVPLLDHRLVEFAWSLPQRMLARDGQAKWLLRQLALRCLPAKIMDRPKSGFGIPVSSWIRGPLRDWAESLLTEERLKRDGLLNARLVRQQWQRHLRQPLQGDERQWQLLAFLAWSAANDVAS